MARERQNDEQESLHERGGVAVLTAEALRSPANRPSEQTKAEEGISLFWRVFGGTILSIAALVVITVYNQVNTTLSELRHDLNQLQEARGDMVKKDELNTRFTTMWGSVKDLQTSNTNLAALNERSQLLNQQLEKQIKSGDDDRKDQQRKFDEQLKLVIANDKEQTQKIQSLAERLATVEGRQSVAFPTATSSSGLTPKNSVVGPRPQ